MRAFLLSTYTLSVREVNHFLRRKSRIIGAVLQPFIFWLLIGTGMNASFKPDTVHGITYTEYFYPGIILMIIMFTSIFATISIIEDRTQGFLQGVLAAPVPRLGIVTGKILGGTILGLIHGALFLPLIFTPLVDLTLTVQSFFCLLCCMFLLGFALTGLGTIMAWSVDSVHGYHAIMSVVLFPLWIFSGAVFPAAGAPVWLYWIMTLNPLTHGLNLMRYVFYFESDPPYLDATTIGLSAAIVIAFGLINLTVATWLVSRQK